MLFFFFFDPPADWPRREGSARGRPGRLEDHAQKTTARQNLVGFGVQVYLPK